MRLYMLFMFLFLLPSCSDKVNQKEKDILKYNYLQPFTLERGKFIGGKLDVDNNILEYSYQVIDVSKEMKIIKDKAIGDGWKFENNSFEKYVKIYEIDGEKMNVKITKTHNKITFKVQSE